MVTLCYLRRFLVMLTDLLGENTAEELSVSKEVSTFFEGIHAALKKHRSMLNAAIRAEDRKVFMDEMGALGEEYRASIYHGFSGQKGPLDKPGLLAFIEIALNFMDQTISLNRRVDGLFHSYNLIHFADEGYGLEPLYEMLEGQVAVLSSGYLSAPDSLALLDALRNSKMYRLDQNSYMLYPYRKLPLFLEKNVIAPELVAGNAWIQNELKSGRKAFLEQDLNDRVHFNGRFRNAGELSAALEQDKDITAEDADALCEVYEATFRHRQFTGRSGSMYKYEGLGCIYWHMVSKLLLATTEVILSASPGSTDKTTLSRLFAHFEEIKAGLGMHKTPAQYGAFPSDPYSHTPGFAGVQQPGMTGQVKEDVITRFGELGVQIKDGEITFAPIMLKRDEFLSEPETWRYSVGGAEQSEELAAGSLAFTLCAVPVIYRLAKECAIRVFVDDGGPEEIAGNQLGPAWSRSLFQREKRVQKILVDISADRLR